MGHPMSVGVLAAGLAMGPVTGTHAVTPDHTDQGLGTASSRLIRATGDTAAFMTPSGNIVCDLSTWDGQTTVRCDTHFNTWRNRLRRPRWCETDYGNGLFLGQAKRGQITCAGDTSSTHHGFRLSRTTYLTW